MGTVKRGYIWKSDREWSAELGLSYDQLSRVRRVLAPLVEIYQKKARNRSTHYQPKARALIKRIAEVLGITWAQVRDVIPGKAQSASSGKPNMHSGESPETLTTLPSNSLSSNEDKDTNNNNQAAVVDNLIDPIDENPLEDDPPEVDYLVKQGVWRSVARRYAWVPRSVIDELLRVVADKRECNDLKGSVGGYVAGALAKYSEHMQKEYTKRTILGENLPFAEFVAQSSDEKVTENQITGNWSDFID